MPCLRPMSEKIHTEIQNTFSLQMNRDETGLGLGKQVEKHIHTIRTRTGQSWHSFP